MNVNIVTENGVSNLSIKTNFNDVLDENFAAICEAIANKGMVLKELVGLFEKESKSLEMIIQIIATLRDENKAMRVLPEKLGINSRTAQYLLGLSFEKMSVLNAKNLKMMLDDYKANIGKLDV